MPGEFPLASYTIQMDNYSHVAPLPYQCSQSLLLEQEVNTHSPLTLHQLPRPPFISFISQGFRTFCLLRRILTNFFIIIYYYFNRKIIIELSLYQPCVIRYKIEYIDIKIYENSFDTISCLFSESTCHIPYIQWIH